MPTITHYIIHRSIDMNTLVGMVLNSIAQGFQPYGDLVAVPVRVDAAGAMAVDGGTASISYIQAMVKYAAE